MAAVFWSCEERGAVSGGAELRGSWSMVVIIEQRRAIIRPQVLEDWVTCAREGSRSAGKRFDKFAKEQSSLLQNKAFAVR